MFNWYGAVYGYYHLGLYSNDELELFAACGWITNDEKDMISGGK